MEFQKYIACICEGTAERVIMNLLLDNDKLNFVREDLLEEEEECGTFILTIGLLAKENDISNSKINKLLKELKRNKNYWKYLKEDSMELYEVRMDLLRELT